MKDSWKKFAALAAAGAMLAVSQLPVLAQDTVGEKQKPGFVRLEGEFDWGNWGLSTICFVARDKETKQVLPVSFAYDEGVYALTDRPAEELEIFQAEEPSYLDTDRFAARFLTTRGVFMGGGDGCFYPEHAITRAEAVAVIARFLGIAPTAGADSGYADVAPGSWYAPVIAAAKNAGIISPDELFRPNALVSNQEFHAMACRAIEAYGLLCEGSSQGWEYSDLNEADEYAQEAYRKLDDCGIVMPVRVEFEGEEGERAGNYLKPKLEITRLDAAELLYRAISELPVVPSREAVTVGLDAVMPKVDGSTSTYPLTESLYWRLFSNGAKHPARPAVHSKTIDSYKKLIAGETDIILVPDANDEVRRLAKESGVELEAVPIANEALVFFTSAENPAENLTSQQVKEIYVENRYTNWSEIGGPDKRLIPFCRNNDSGSHAQMEKFFLEGKEINKDIARENTSTEMASVLTDVMSSDHNNPDSFALGYSMFYYYKNVSMFYGWGMAGEPPVLKLLSVDGVAPTEDSIANGSYPLSTHYYAVMRASEEEASPARRLADYLSGEQGRNIIRNAGFGPVYSPEELAE